jgi:hypothetical protein
LHQVLAAHRQEKVRDIDVQSGIVNRLLQRKAFIKKATASLALTLCFSTPNRGVIATILQRITGNSRKHWQAGGPAKK